MIKKLINIIQRKFCNHTYNSDTQLKVIKCSKCGDKRWYQYKNIFDDSI